MQSCALGSPYELLAGKRQADLFKQAIAEAGRQGIGLYAVGAPRRRIMGCWGADGIPGGYGPKRDIVLVLSQVEIKTSYESLFKVAQAYNCDGITYGGSWSMIGGYAGGPEGSALSCIVCTILLYNVYQCVNGASFPYDLHYMGNCGRSALWSLGLVFQALSRNTHICANSVLNQTVRTGHGDVALRIGSRDDGAGCMRRGSCTGPRSAGGKYTNHITPLR